MHRVRLQFLPIIIALAAISQPATASTALCTLNTLDEQLLAPELRSETPQYAERNYRKQLLRFVNAYYSSLASDLLRGNGDHLTALHRLMGSTDNNLCTETYRELLLTEVTSQNFALALWALRTTTGYKTKTAQAESRDPAEW